MTLSGFVSFLIAGAQAGVYVEPLRRFWTPWPSDSAKFAITLSAFLISAMLIVWSKRT